MKRIENHVRHTENLLNAIKIAMTNPTSNLNNWIEPCGTLGCVLGTYILNYRKKLIQHLVDLKNPVQRGIFHDICSEFDFKKEFGFDKYFGEQKCFNVVGTQNNGSLFIRLKYVSKQLEILKSKVA